MIAAACASEVMLPSCGLLAASSIRVALPRTRFLLQPMPLVPAQRARGKGSVDQVSNALERPRLGAPPPHALFQTCKQHAGSCSPVAECTPWLPAADVLACPGKPPHTHPTQQIAISMSELAKHNPSHTMCAHTRTRTHQRTSLLNFLGLVSAPLVLAVSLALFASANLPPVPALLLLLVSPPSCSCCCSMRTLLLTAGFLLLGADGASAASCLSSKRRSACRAICSCTRCFNASSLLLTFLPRNDMSRWWCGGALRASRNVEACVARG